MAATRSIHRFNLAWLFPALFIVGAGLVRSDLGSAWRFLTMVNLTAACAFAARIRQRPRATMWLWAAASVLVLGGFVQLCWLAYKLKADPVYLPVYVPQVEWLSPADVAHAYGEFTLLFMFFCAFAVAWSYLSPMDRFGRLPRVSGRRLKVWLLWAAVVYLALSAWQWKLGYGQFGVAASATPFHSTTAISFYRQELFPSLLLLGLWAFDGRDRRWWWACLTGTGVAAAIESYISTSRGTPFTYGLPILFLWFVARRFTNTRRTLIIFGIVTYLAISPVLTIVRSERLQSTQIQSGLALPQDSGFSIAGLSQTLDHTVIRVGTAEGVLSAQHDSQPDLGIRGLVDLAKPNFMAQYFTFSVVGLSPDTGIADYRSPSALGNAILVGGDGVGAVAVLIVILAALGAAWTVFVRRFYSWPVATALLSGAIVSYFSEGGEVTVYKYVLAAIVLESLYRRLIPRRPIPTHPAVMVRQSGLARDDRPAARAGP